MRDSVRESTKLAQIPMPTPLVIHPILEFKEAVELFHGIIGCSGWHY
ncbi:MAG: hypothetical protein WBE76_13775 [Terracidiphilus sp.]